MSKHKDKPAPELPGFETPVKLTLEQHIPDPGQVGSALWSTILQLPSAPFQMVDAISELLPDFEAE